MEPVLELALGGTAVGTGLNTPKGYDVAGGEKNRRIHRACPS
jgi:fumarate hydratase class II